MDEQKKLTEHAAHIDYALTHPQLRTLIWEATRNCNYGCKHCCIPRGDWDPQKELTTEQAQKIFSDIATDFKPSDIHVAITGGEATLRKDLVEMVKFLVGLSFRHVSVDSNGLNYSKDLTLLDRLFAVGMTSPTVGVDGLKEGYRKTRGIDAFDDIIKVLKYITSKYPERYVTTFSVVNNHNRQEIPALLNLLADIGIKYARVSPVMEIGRVATLGEDVFRLSPEHLHDLLMLVGQKRQEYKRGKFPMEVELSEDGWCGLAYECFTKPETSIFFCNTGLNVATILYDGKIAACPHITRELTVQGDALTQRLLDIWNNEFKPFRAREWLKIGKCKDCDQWHYCRGGPLHYRDASGNMKKCLYWDNMKPVMDAYGSEDAQAIKRKTATRIAIVGGQDEAHTMHMKQVLEAHNVEVILVDTLNFPQQVTASLVNDAFKYQRELLEDARTFYVRTVFYSHPPYDLEELRKAKQLDLDGWYAQYMGERERQSFLTSWLRTAALGGKNVINPVESFDLHYLKPFQLALLRKHAIPVPPTLVTNDPEELKIFQQQIGELVYKPVAGGAECKKLTPADWTQDKIELLRNAPVLFQQYIPGHNIRVYVIGEAVVASGIIHTQEVDYREHEQGVERVQLPEEINQMCIRAMKACGMKFTGIDLKLTPGGNYVLIECNPSPMFIGFQQATGVAIDEAFAQFLMQQA